MSPGFGSSIIYFVLLFAILYFLFIRPQQKRVKDLKELMESLKVGDEVVTIGGMIGKIISIEDDEADLEIAAGVVVKIVKNSISRVKGKEVEV